MVNLLADCANCFGLCCVALPFEKSVDFAHSKAGGEPCINLRGDFRCGIHTELRQRGYRGCTVFDCFGAGQKVSQDMFDGVSWQANPRSSADMFAVFPVVRQLHELLWYLNEASELAASAPIASDLSAMYQRTNHLSEGTVAEVLAVDVETHRAEVNVLLLEASELTRATLGMKKKERSRKNLRGADLIGAQLKGADLRGANLRGARLIAADLRDADLRVADVIGADFRNADISGANLTGCLFLVQSQVDAAVGDKRTSLPPSLAHPLHWTK